jgi:hypothetical protein
MEPNAATMDRISDGALLHDIHFVCQPLRRFRRADRARIR